MELSVYLLVVLYNLHSFVVTEALEAFKGSTVQLKCMFIANSGSGQRPSWIKNSMILSENTILANTNAKERLTITGDHGIEEYHLNISDVRESDQATYKCSITGTTKVETQELIVIVGPTLITIDNVTPDNTIAGIEGKDMTIKCLAVGGQPPPDVKLLILESTYTGKQSAQHTFKPVSANDGFNLTCQAGYAEFEHYPLTTSAQIHLMFKPVLTPFAADTLNTEETKYFDVSCQSTGSRLAASMYWLLGQQRIDVTSNATSQTNEESSTDRYTVTSNLRYRLDRRYNGQKLICGAVNIAGYMETSLTLNVTYPPDVKVENKTFSQTQSSRQIQSTLDCNPQVNTCRWLHRSKYGEIVREFSANNQILTLPTVSEDKRYQDTGEYVCTAENGIIGFNGQVKQSGFGYVTIIAPPVITADNKDNSTQYGKFGKNIEVYVNVYSIPKYSRISWCIGNTQLVSNKYAIKEELAIVKDVFHGVDVHLDGYRVTLTISDLQEADFTNYTLRLYYSSQYVQYEVTLESASAPDIPSNFSIASSGKTSITVQWIPGYDGGHMQIFFMEYRISGTKTWVPHKMRTSNQFNTHNVYTLSGLQDKTTYELRMFAENRFNQSQRTDIETATTIKTDATASSDAIIGAVTSVIVVLLIVCVVIVSFVILKRRKGQKPTEKNAAYYENSGVTKEQMGEEYEEVANTRGMQHKQCSKTYESLCTKDVVGAIGVYDELHSSEGKTSSKFPGDNYEALSAQDKPILYEELSNRKGKTEEVYVNEVL